MAEVEEQDLTQEEALVRAQEAASNGVLAQMGIVIQSSDDVRLRMLSALVDATTVDDILKENATDGWGEHEGRSVIIRDASYAPSTKKGGLGFYVIVNALSVADEKPLVLTSGSENVVIQVAKLMAAGATEVPVKLVANQTGDGNTVHRLVKGEVGVKPPF